MNLSTRIIIYKKYFLYKIIFRLKVLYSILLLMAKLNKNYFYRKKNIFIHNTLKYFKLKAPKWGL